MAAANATQRTFRIQAQTPAGIGTHAYIDLAGLLSAQNKRLYRQGMVYHARVSVTNFNASGPVSRDIAVLHNSWRTRKAWATARDAWMESSKEERAKGKRSARWSDFRVFYQDDHFNSNTFGPTTAGDGEWLYSSVYNQATSSNFSFEMLGPGGANRFGMLREYDLMNDQQQDQPAASGAFIAYGNIDANLDATTASNLAEEGDLPPYSATDLQRETAETIYRLGVPNTTDNLITSTQGFIEIPCGLIKLETSQQPDVTNYELRIDFKPGRYKGVHAEAMA